MRGYQWDFGVILRNYEPLLAAVQTTLKIFAFVLLLSLLLGFLFALLSMSRFRAVDRGVTLLVQVVRSLPPLVWLVWMYYCLPVITGYGFSAVSTAVVGISLYLSVFFAEIFRAGIQSIDKGLVEAAQSIGMRRGQVLRYVLGPLGFFRIVPPLTSQCVVAFKSCTLASYVAVPELLFETKRLSIETFRPLEFLTALAALYIVMILPTTFLIGALEARWRRKYQP